MLKSTVVIGLSGLHFSPFWGFAELEFQKRSRILDSVCKHLGFGFVSVEPLFEDAEGAAQAARSLNEKADVAVLDVATFPEGKASIAFFDHLELPVVLWCRPESKHKTNIGHNSFCGANFLAGNLALRGKRFRHVFGNPNSSEFQNRIFTAGTLVRAAKACQGGKIGLLGEGIVPKFYDIDLSATGRANLTKRWGIRFVDVPVQELVGLVDSFKRNELEKEGRAFIRHFARVDVDSQEIDRLVRLLLAIRSICAKYGFDSIAIRCWPELQTLYQAWPCPCISILNQEGIPAACEGDSGGALDMLLASKLSKEPSTLMDIVDWDDKGKAFSIWHCGPTAPCWADATGMTLLHHNVDGATSQGKPAFGLAGICHMQFKPGPVTVFRTLGALDDEFVVEGKLETTKNKHICGSFGRVGQPAFYARPVDGFFLREQILTRCLPHHYTAVRGRIFNFRAQTRK